MAFAWTDAAVEKLREAVLQNKSAGAIADEFCRTIGYVTRNAVVGKAHRLGLSLSSSNVSLPRVTRSPGTPGRKAARQRRNGFNAVERMLALAGDTISPEIEAKLQPQFASAHVVGEPADYPAYAPTPFLNVRYSQCRYPLWGPHQKIGDCCGQRRSQNYPYCITHLNLCTGQ